MRPFSLCLAALLLVLGAGMAWVGVTVGYRAIDPDAYRDSRPLVYLAAGGLFGGAGLALLVGAMATARLAFERPVGRWLVAVIFGLGCIPYPWLFGPPAIVLNLLLLGMAVYLLAGTREPARHNVRGPMA